MSNQILEECTRAKQHSRAERHRVGWLVDQLMERRRELAKQCFAVDRALEIVVDHPEMEQKFNEFLELQSLLAGLGMGGER